jgi:hypothetical protein
MVCRADAQRNVPIRNFEKLAEQLNGRLDVLVVLIQEIRLVGDTEQADRAIGSINWYRARVDCLSALPFTEANERLAFVLIDIVHDLRREIEKAHANATAAKQDEDVF